MEQLKRNNKTLYQEKESGKGRMKRPFLHYRMMMLAQLKSSPR